MPRRLIPVKLITGADLASADTEKADFTVIMTAAVNSDSDFFFLEKFKKRGADVTEAMNELLRQMTKYNSTGYIEYNRFEFIMKTARTLVRAGFYGDPVTVNRVLNRIVTIGHYTDKVSRIIDTLQQPNRAGKLYIPSHWNDVRDQFLFYPAVEHDDLLDCIHIIVANATAPTHTTAGIQDYHQGTGRLISGRIAAPMTLNGQLAARKYNVWTGTYKRN